jgi:hypothetical protein
MQFTGKSGIAVFVLLILGAAGLGFGSGLLVGRQFPAHHFEKMENSHYLLDTSTGHVCDFLPVQVGQQTTSTYSGWGPLGNGPNAPVPPCNN